MVHDHESLVHEFMMIDGPLLDKTCHGAALPRHEDGHQLLSLSQPAQPPAFTLRSGSEAKSR